MTERCFACNRKINNPNNSKNRAVFVFTSDGQRVYIGLECYDHVKYWHERGGYQPPLGGPKLFLVAEKALSEIAALKGASGER